MTAPDPALRCVLAKQVGSGSGQAIVNLYVSANRPAQLLETLLEHHLPCLCLSITHSHWHENADAPHALGLLRAGDERPG